MTKRIVRGSSWMAVLALAICLVAQTAWARNPKNVVYVIGDSISDPGKLYDLTGFFPPSPPYDKRFSNGPVWAEYFAGKLRVKLESLAYGGAFTGVIELPKQGGGTATFSNYNSYQYFQNNPDLDNLPGVAEEVESLLASHPEGLNPNALYVVWAGSNDLFAALQNQTLLLSIMDQAVSNLTNAVCDLGAAGAKHFIVANLPDIGLTPYANSIPGLPVILTDVSAAFNEALQTALTALPRWCAKTLVIVDAFRTLQGFVADPESYGLVNVTEECIKAPADTDCSTYLFWDEVHPTTYGHSLIAEQFRADFCGTGNQHPGLRGRPNRQLPPIWRDACYGSK